MKDPELTKEELSKEELSNLLHKREEELEKIHRELQILKNDEAVLKETIIRLAMKTVRMIQ